MCPCGKNGSYNNFNFFLHGPGIAVLTIMRHWNIVYKIISTKSSDTIRIGGKF